MVALHKNANDLSGLRFGRLVAISPTNRRSGPFIVWKCRCDCGNIKYIRSAHLWGGRIVSCGCYSKEVASELNSARLEGRTFGRLKVVRREGSNKRGSAVWRCACVCGKETLAISYQLLHGKKSSCGCLQRGVTSVAATKGGLSRTIEYRREETLKRVALRKKATVRPISVEEIKRITRCGRCVYCGGKYEHLDHIVPLSRGGEHSAHNLIASCAKCNLSKSNKILGEEWTPPVVREFWD